MKIITKGDYEMSIEEEEFLRNLDPESDLAYEIFDIEGNMRK